MLSKQPIINIGLLGSVSHGKSTLVKLISGKATQQHSKEQVKNITMKVGYANAKIWEKDGNLIHTSSEEDLDETFKLVHHFSFVDCPGHHELLETMMGGATVMDGGIVVVAGNQEPKSQPQLLQHLRTAKILELKNLIFILNKLDLVNEETAKERYYQLKEFLKENDFDDDYLIIPMALNLGLNKKYLLQAILKHFPPIIKERMEELEFSITRSFDINKPGIFPKDLKGGVVGGSLISGELKVGDEIEIRPGRLRFDQSKNQWFAKPFISQVNTLQSEKSSLESIIPGGLMAIGLDLDSFFTKNDGLKGSILGLKGKLPKIYSTLTLETELKLKDSHLYHLQIGANSVKGKYQQKTKNFLLTQPVCVDETKKILICDKIDGILTILDLGIFVDGAEVILV